MLPSGIDSPQDYDTAMEEALFKHDFIRFLVILETEKCTQHGLNNCLAFAAAAHGLGNFSEELLEAGAEMYLYLNGRRSRCRWNFTPQDMWIRIG